MRRIPYSIRLLPLTIETARQAPALHRLLCIRPKPRSADCGSAREPGARGPELCRLVRLLTSRRPILGAEWESSSTSASSRAPWLRYGISGALGYQRRLTRFTRTRNDDRVMP